VVLVNGKLLNQSNNKPVATKIKFIDIDGKVNSAASNSEDGSYQIVVQSGKDYGIVVEGWLPSNEMQRISIPAFTEYSELNYDFSLVQIKKGLILSAGNFFEKNSNKIKPEGLEQFQNIKNLLTEQKGLVFEALIRSGDSYFKKKTYNETYKIKGKTRTRKATLTTESQLLELLDKRKSALIEILETNNIPLKSVNIKVELQVRDPQKNSSKIKTNKKSKSFTIEEVFSENLTISIDKVIKL
jgi:hypothetical protein